MIDAVVTHHRDSFRSGVGRFNELLGERLGVPVIGIRKLLTAGAKRPLLSFKVSELAPRSFVYSQQLVDDEPFEWELFLHVYDGHPLEEALVAGRRTSMPGTTRCSRRSRASRTRSTRSGRPA